ncbi:MAG: DUF444 family protein [Desulfobacteraceae bacterium]|nr:DUF444 family protein [Desulfobacteraceae bacterium]
MKSELKKIYKRLKSEGLSAERDAKIRLEVDGELTHDPPAAPYGDLPTGTDGLSPIKKLYAYHDMAVLQATSGAQSSSTNRIQTMDELLEKDKLREKDGFPRKIRVGRMIKPGKAGQGKIVVIPTTVEEKFMHDPTMKPTDDEQAGGHGEGEEGEVIGEQPIHDPQDQSGAGPGEGEGGQHEMESSAYDLGRILTEQFELPNLKEKGKKRSLTRYTYDLTDKNRGFGQVLDKKATLKQIVETNISLGNLPDMNDIDPTGFLIAPSDKIYRILSREKDYESQAMIFFLRDYSGSMAGKTTELVVAQHVLIYSWLLYQYANQVETRFILHDTSAKEVKDFYTYYNSRVAGGTQVSSAYRLVNEIVENENLRSDYNIYVFHGTDGDDWDTDGRESIPELKKILSYASRTGITIAEHSSGSSTKTEVERYLLRSELLEKMPKLIRLDVISEDADEKRLIDGIRKLISE